VQVDKDYGQDRRSGAARPALIRALSPALLWFFRVIRSQADELLWTLVVDVFETVYQKEHVRMAIIMWWQDQDSSRQSVAVSSRSASALSLLLMSIPPSKYSGNVGHALAVKTRRRKPQ
jgi:hypothetical protein